MVPSVSVLMTSYNPGAYLKPALDSLLNQSNPDFEVIVVDDGSTDGAKAVIRACAGADPRIRVCDLPDNIGRTPALNLALSQATGEFIAVLDADDLSRPERLEKQVAYLRANPGVVAVGTWCDVMDSGGALTDVFQPPAEPEAVYQSLVFENPLAHSAIMYRRQAALEAGGYPADFVFAQDFALWLALAGRGKLANLPEWLTVLRRHQTNMTFQSALQQVRPAEMLRLFERAAARGGYSVEALRRSRQTMAGIRARYGVVLCRAGQVRAGLGLLFRACAADPACWVTVPEIRRWTGIELLSGRLRRHRPHPRLQPRLAGFAADQSRLDARIAARE